MGRISLEELDENLKKIISESNKDILASEISIQDNDDMFEASNVEEALKENRKSIISNREEIDSLKQSGVNIKTNTVQAINSKKTVSDVSINDSWDILIQKILEIKEGSGNATINDVLAGKTFTNSNGIEYTGVLNIGGTATTSDVLSGKTFTDDSKTIKTGTMVNRGGAQTITPGTSGKTLNSGYYSGNITVTGDSNLISSNILSGKSIFGINGNVTLSSLGGRKYASGSGTLSNYTYFTNIGNKDYVEINLDFKPNIIIACVASGTIWRYVTFFVRSFEARVCNMGYRSDSSSVSNTQAWTPLDSVVNPSGNTYRIFFPFYKSSGPTAVWFACE